jgi:ribonuclease D
VPRDRKPEPESIGLVELLQAVLKARAAEAEIAPTLLATSGDLQALVEAKEKRKTPDLPVLRGWRRELIGDLLVQILDGRVRVSVDPEKGVLRMSGDPVTHPQ